MIHGIPNRPKPIFTKRTLLVEMYIRVDVRAGPCHHAPCRHQNRQGLAADAAFFLCPMKSQLSSKIEKPGQSAFMVDILSVTDILSEKYIW